MNEVQPIRDKEKIEMMKHELLRKSYRDYFLFLFGLNSGLRISDVLKLKVKDVKNKTYVVLKEAKSDKTKRFRINSELQNKIEEYTKHMDENHYLFPSQRSGNPISRIQAYRVIKEAAKKVGIEEIGTHTMRKTFGYHYYKKTKDIAMLQEIFNHSAPSITKKYIGITQDEIDESLDDFNL